MIKTKLVEELHRIAGNGKGGFIITNGSEMQIECLLVFIESLLAEQKKELVEEILSKLPPKFKRQDLGNKWNLETGEMQPYWCQSEEAVEYYNDCRQEVIDIIELLNHHD